MSAQVTLLDPPSGPVATVPAKQGVAWVPVHPLDPSLETQQSLEPLSRQGPRPRTNPPPKLNRVTRRDATAFGVSAHSLQFVASPGQTNKLQSILPGTIREVLSRVPSFAGYMVVVSEQEARRITIFTFWQGDRRPSSGTVGKLKARLVPYVDDWLRAENHVAHGAMCAPTEEPGALLFQKVTLP